MEFERVIPILNVKNFSTSMNRINKLGFSKKWVWGNRRLLVVLRGARSRFSL